MQIFTPVLNGAVVVVVVVVVVDAAADAGDDKNLQFYSFEARQEKK